MPRKKLGSTTLQVLLAIAQGKHTNKEITKHLGIYKSLTAYHLKKLQKEGLIKRTVTDAVVIYELTEAGKSYCESILNLSPQESPMKIRAHNMFFKVKIIRKPANLDRRLKEANWIEFYPRNYRAWRKKTEKASLVFKPNVLEIYLGDIYAATQQEAMSKAIKTVLEIIEELEHIYPGLKLAKPEEVARIEKQHFAIQNDPLATLYVQQGKSYRSDRIHIDHSKGIPELETVHKLHASEDVHKITQFYEELIREDFSIRDLKEFMLLVVQDRINLQNSLHTLQNTITGLQKTVEFLLMVMGQGANPPAMTPSVGPS